MGTPLEAYSLPLPEQIGSVAGEGPLAWGSTVSVISRLRIGPQLGEIKFPFKNISQA